MSAMAGGKARNDQMRPSAASHRWGSKSHRKTHNCEKLTHSLRQALRQAVRQALRFLGSEGVWLPNAVYGLPEGLTLCIDRFRFRSLLVLATRDVDVYDPV